MRLNKLLSSVADAGRDMLFKGQVRANGKSLEAYCEDLCSNRGQALGTALAREVVDAYSRTNDEDKLNFFYHLLNHYSTDPDKVLEAAQNYKENGDFSAFQQLYFAVESPRQDLFRRINLAPGGIEVLIQLRDDVLKVTRSHPDLKPIDFDLKHLLNSWFNRGFLTLEEIDWKTPADILEKLIEYEAVHAMDGWDDLKKRLGVNRRCFGFFHPSLPSEPLIFVEVALVTGIADKIQPLIEPSTLSEDDSIDTAIFYSISNCQSGLKGISFGNFLIKQVVMELKKELPHLKHFSTLSPIPGFRKWLNKECENPDSRIVSPQELVTLKALESPDWYADDHLANELKPLLLRLCGHYLYRAKRKGGPLDPVANFHLGNGAAILRLNWLADQSENGMAQSAGLMVNYYYDADRVERNHERFMNLREIAIIRDFKKLVS